MSPEHLKLLADLNLTTEQMAGVLRVVAEVSEGIERRRASDRDRQMRHRMSRDNNVTCHVTVTRDNNVTQPSLPLDPPPLPPAPPTSPPIIPLSPVVAPEAKRKAMRLPIDWEPEVEDIRKAYAEGLDELEARREFEKFKDYWHSRAGAGGTKLDWRATFRNWMRRAADDKGQRQIRNGNGKYHS